MPISVKIAAGVIAFVHVYILVLEMFLFGKAPGRRVFGLSREDQQNKLVLTLAANQGLYNGFLAAGLIWSLFAPELYAIAVARFFFGCVLVAGLYGGATAKKSILLVQALPATIGLVLTFL